MVVDITFKKFWSFDNTTRSWIVQLKLDYPHLKALSGVKFDGYATLLVDNEIVKKDFGEILFTDYGISGPPILQISALASQNTFNKKKTEVIVVYYLAIQKKS